MLPDEVIKFIGKSIGVIVCEVEKGTKNVPKNRDTRLYKVLTG